MQESRSVEDLQRKDNLRVGINRLGAQWNFTTGIWGGSAVHVVFDNTYLQSVTLADKAALFREVGCYSH